jgi:hypothetical protein
MATPRQIQANRLNARKSTGPRTLQGKSVSRFNALKTGIDSISEIIPGEDYDELSILSAEYYHRWQPSLPEERCLVDILVSDEWQLRRLRKAEAQLWIHVQMMYCIQDGRKTNAHQGAVLERGGQEFARLQRRIVAIEKSYHLNLEKLEAMEAGAPGAADPPPDAEPVQPAPPQPLVEPPPETGAQSQPPVGFVPQVASQHAEAASAQAGNGPLGCKAEPPQPEVSMEIGSSHPFSTAG